MTATYLTWRPLSQVCGILVYSFGTLLKLHGATPLIVLQIYLPYTRCFLCTVFAIDALMPEFVRPVVFCTCAQAAAKTCHTGLFLTNSSADGVSLQALCTATNSTATGCTWFVVFQGLKESGSPSLNFMTLLPLYFSCLCRNNQLKHEHSSITKQ